MTFSFTLKQSPLECLPDFFGPLSPQTFSLLLGRSSLTSKGITVHSGVIDSDYKGEIQIMMSSQILWQLKNGEYKGTLLSSLSKADFTRFQHKIFSKPITIVNTALFVLNFLILPLGVSLTRAEKHFEELKDTSLPLPIWYQDNGSTKQRKSGKLILQGKGYACISSDGSNEFTWLPLRKI